MGCDACWASAGPLTVGDGQVGGAMCPRYADGDRPDLHLFTRPLSVDKPGKPLHDYPGFTASFWQCHPESQGSVRITSTDPLSDPQIKVIYLSETRGCDVMVESLRIAREICTNPVSRIS